eukprot:403355142
MLNRRYSRDDDSMENIGQARKESRSRDRSVQSSSQRIKQEIDMVEDDNNAGDNFQISQSQSMFSQVESLKKTIQKEKMKRDHSMFPNLISNILIEYNRSMSEYSDKSYDSSEEIKLQSHNKLVAQHQRMKTSVGTGQNQTHKTNESKVISNEEANDIFQRLLAQNSKRKYTTKRNWNDDETKLLNWAISTYSEKRGINGEGFTAADWQNVAKLVPGRNDAQCQYKWNQGHKSSITKTQWQKKEDDELFSIISEKGTKQWQEIAEVLNAKLGVTRNGKQCRERWYNFLNPEINRDPFSNDEDLKILKLRKQIGNRWSEIVKQLPGRTENSVKNRFNCMFKKIKDEKLQNIQENDMGDVLEKIENQNNESTLDEDEILETLIIKKTQQIQQEKLSQAMNDQQNIVVQNNNVQSNEGSDAMMQSVNLQNYNNASSQLQSSIQSSPSMNINCMRQVLSPAFVDNLGTELFIGNDGSSNRTKINYVLKQIIEQTPQNTNKVKYLAQLIEQEVKESVKLALQKNIEETIETNKLPSTLQQYRLSRQGNDGTNIVTSGKMSLDQVSPNLDSGANQGSDPRTSGQMQKRPSRSNSMVASLEKLTSKLMNRNQNSTEGSDMKIDSRINQKKFVEESTREILIVTRDGCYTYQTHNENQLIVSKLKDVREILDSGLQSLQPGIIQPGQSATGTPNQNQGGMPQMNPNDQKALEMFQISNVSEMFRPIQLKYTQTNQQQMNQQRQGFTKFTPPFSTDRQKVSPQAFLVNGQNAFSNQQATPMSNLSNNTPPWNVYPQFQQMQMQGTSPQQQLDTRYLLMQPMQNMVSPGQQNQLRSNQLIMGQTQPQTGYISNLLNRSASSDVVLNKNQNQTPPQQQMYMVQGNQGIGQLMTISPNDLLNNQSHMQQQARYRQEQNQN